MRVLPHMTTLTTAIDRAFDEGIATDGHIGLVGDTQGIRILEVSGFIAFTKWLPCISATIHIITSGIGIVVGQHTLAGTEDVAVEGRHRHIVGADFCIASDLNGTHASVFQTKRLTNSNAIIGGIC